MHYTKTLILSDKDYIKTYFKKLTINNSIQLYHLTTSMDKIKKPNDDCINTY
jgi:hypothetical protein